VQTVGPGEVVGWSWLVPPHRWRFDARALKASHVIALDGDVVRRALRAHPAWGFQFMVRFMPVLAERLENTRVQLLDIYAR
jgi:CRP-like cAMP-binding protein